jgi:hypothetical protein
MLKSTFKIFPKVRTTQAIPYFKKEIGESFGTMNVVNSTDLNPIYAYFMPIINRIWLRYMEYNPVSLLYGSENLWRSTKINSFLLDEIKATAPIHFVRPVPGYKSSSVMQIARIVVMIISDVDMIPMSRSYFRQQSSAKKFHIFSADAYRDHQRFPMCYLGAQSKYWREIFGITTNDISFETAKSLEGRLDYWENDEAYAANKIKSSKYYKNNEMQLMVRGWHNQAPYFVGNKSVSGCGNAFNRLERGLWYFNGQKSLIDAHSPRPGYDYLPELLTLFNSYFKNDIVDFLQSYTNQFKKNL